MHYIGIKRKSQGKLLKGLMEGSYVNYFTFLKDDLATARIMELKEAEWKHTAQLGGYSSGLGKRSL